MSRSKLSELQLRDRGNLAAGRLRQILISERASIRHAMEAIERGSMELALVVEPDLRLIGTITDGDVRRALLQGHGLDQSVALCMNRGFTSVDGRAGRAEVLDLMRARTLRQIPILDGAGRLTGLHLLREMIGAVQRPNWAVVMAGGRGERLRPLTDSIPKPMLPVAGRPILERIVLHLVGSGVQRIFFSVFYLGEQIEAHFGDGSAHGCSISYLRETEPLGTGGSLSLLPERPEHPLLVLNGDLLTQVNVDRLLSFHEQGRYAVTIGLHEHAHTVPFGVVELDGDRVVHIKEKPTQVWPASCGIYVIDPGIIDRVPGQTRVDLPSLIEQCIERGERVGGFLVEDEWMDIGRQRELDRARGNGADTP